MNFFFFPEKWPRMVCHCFVLSLRVKFLGKQSPLSFFQSCAELQKMENLNFITLQLEGGKGNL